MFKSIPIILNLLINRNITLIYSINLWTKTKSCARSGSFQRKLQHHCFQLWCLAAMIREALVFRMERSPQQGSLGEHLLWMIECTQCNLADQHDAWKRDIQARIEKKCQKLQVKFLQGFPKFVPLISCTIAFDQNFIFTWNFKKMFISLSSTCIQNFSNWHGLFVFLSHSVAVATEYNGIQLVVPQMIHFELFFTWCAGSSSTPKHYLFSLGSWKTISWAFFQKR